MPNQITRRQPRGSMANRAFVRPLPPSMAPGAGRRNDGEQEAM